MTLTEKTLTRIIVLMWLPNCTITTVNIPQKTALENQLIGEMLPLTEEELLLASVRSETEAQTFASQPSIAARRRQLFNRDDIIEFKKKGCLGESLKAQLVFQPCELADQENSSLRRKLIEEENKDREVIITWFIINDPTLAPSDRNQVIEIYRQLLIRQSPTGTPIQKTAASWSPKNQEPQLQQ